MKSDSGQIRALVQSALDEDIGRGDLTSLACLEPDPVKAQIIVKSKGVFSGTLPATTVFEIVDSANVVNFVVEDGATIDPGMVVAEIEGFNLTVMTSERVALNFLAHLSGVATQTHKFARLVQEAVGDACRILDTRKTTPGWRQLEKMAVVHGGGMNHRFGLYDMILVKDNHIASAGSITTAIDRARNYLDGADFRIQFDAEAKDIDIEVEISTLEQLREAIASGVNRLLLDNQSPGSLKKLVVEARQLKPSVKLEASGNVTLKNVAEMAATGVDFVSIGALTHSAPAVDFSLQVCE